MNTFMELDYVLGLCDSPLHDISLHFKCAAIKVRGHSRSHAHAH